MMSRFPATMGWFRYLLRDSDRGLPKQVYVSLDRGDCLSATVVVRRILGNVNVRLLRTVELHGIRRYSAKGSVTCRRDVFDPNLKF